MTLPFALPVWLPWWASLVLLVVVLLWGLAFLLVPFSVIGVKARLDGLEARLDEIQTEIRTLSLRLPEGGPAAPYEEVYPSPLSAPPPPVASRRSATPPIPPLAVRRTAEPAPPPRVPRRVEPRFDPPR